MSLCPDCYAELSDGVCLVCGYGATIAAATPEPQPIVNHHEPVVDQVLKDVLARADEGLKKYGTRLQPWNGRSQIMDAYQEAIDLTQYLKAKIIEEQALSDFLEVWVRREDYTDQGLIDALTLAWDEYEKTKEGHQ